MSSSPDSVPRPDLRHVLSALVAGLRRMSPDRDLQAVFEQSCSNAFDAIGAIA